MAVDKDWILNWELGFESWEGKRKKNTIQYQNKFIKE
jgi:hypothetical protein